jgi:flagellar motor switch protein FliG
VLTTVADQLKGVEKASILLKSLGSETAAQVFRFLSEEEAERLASELVRPQDFSRETIEAVAAEFDRLRRRLK